MKPQKKNSMFLWSFWIVYLAAKKKFHVSDRRIYIYIIYKINEKFLKERKKKILGHCEDVVLINSLLKFF